MKQQIWYIGGGDSFLDHAEFLTHLRTVGLWHLEEDGVGTSWTRTMAEELEDTHDWMKIPMPNRENARYEEWKLWFERHFDHMKGEPILIGLSLGAMFLAKYLSENDLPLRTKAVFLLAGAYDMGKPLTGTGDFLVAPEKVKRVAEAHRLVIMHSKDDFVVPYEHGEALAKALSAAEFVSFADKNHFLIEEFPELKEKIKQL